MSCRKVQKDSKFAPANEIFINTVLYDYDVRRGLSAKHPNNRNVYQPVKAGYIARGPSQVIWRGRSKNLKMIVSMWEYDDGGRAVDLFSKGLSAALMSAVTRGASKGAPRGVSVPPGQKIDGAKDPIANFFARGYKSLLGTDNDLVGHNIHNITGGNWANLRLKSYRGINYHIATRHTRGKADCSAYFRFYRGAWYKDYDDRQTASTPNRNYSDPAPVSPPRYDKGLEILAKNDTAETIYVAYLYQSLRGDWVTSGWTELVSGQKKQLDIETRNRNIYLYAEGDRLVWDGTGENGSVSKSVIDEAFAVEDGRGLRGTNRRVVTFYQRRIPPSQRTATEAYKCQR